MNWISLEHLLDQTPKSRPVTLAPELDHAELRQQALRLAAGCVTAASPASRFIWKMRVSWPLHCSAPGEPA